MKTNEDFIIGKNKRESEISFINSSLHKGQEGIFFQRKHEYLKTMTIAEKKKHFQLCNIVVKSPFHKAMGLHYSLINRINENEVPFIFEYQEGGLYLKIPKFYLDNPSSYLQTLANLNYYLLIIGSKSTENIRLYSNPISFNIIYLSWTYTMGKTRGNKNRMTFQETHLKGIHYLPLEEPHGFGLAEEESLVKTLISLVS